MKSRKVQRAAEVRDMIERAGLNQCQAARLLGISERSMRRYVSLSPESATEMPGPTFTLLRILTDERAERLSRQPQPQRET